MSIEIVEVTAEIAQFEQEITPIAKDISSLPSEDLLLLRGDLSERMQTLCLQLHDAETRYEENRLRSIAAWALNESFDSTNLQIACQELNKLTVLRHDCIKTVIAVNAAIRQRQLDTRELEGSIAGSYIQNPAMVDNY